MAQILVIDNSLRAGRTARHILRGAGHAVASMELITHLPQLIRDDPPDLILLDLATSSVSAIDVVRLIRRYEPHPIPIVLWSAPSSEEVAAAAQVPGADGRSAARDSGAELLDAVENALRAGAGVC